VFPFSVRFFEQQQQGNAVGIAKDSQSENLQLIQRRQGPVHPLREANEKVGLALPFLRK
jgi:hypothetical protein